MSSMAAASAVSGSTDDKDDVVRSRHDLNDNLCIRCRHIDFEYVGYHASAESSGNNYSVQRQYPALLDTSSSCPFCKKVVDIFADWRSRAPVEQTNRLDLFRSQVDVTLETDWHAVGGADGNLDQKTHSTRIRIHWSIPRTEENDTSRKTQFLTFFLQGYGAPSIDSMYPVHDSSPEPAQPLTPLEPRPQPYIGRRRSLMADLALFKRWKLMCQEVHGEKCAQVFRGFSKIRPRVIDVHQRCLVIAGDDKQWVCLSYVWGQKPALRLTKSNFQSLCMPDSLHSELLPNIIEDALQVTKGIREQYLWVDSLCIIQDDGQDKANFISKMDSIYSQASVVIIAASCIDAHSILPGVRMGSRSLEPEPFNIRSIELVQSLDPATGVEIDLRTGRTAAYLGETIWDTRAWTLQERFLASRSLVFTAEQVFWECEEAFWCEDSLREFPEISPDPHRSSLCGGNLNLSWNSEVITFDLYYRTLLEEYSGRTLTFESDGLNAFAGIARAFERSAKETFFWGMPTAYLESALAWGHRTQNLRRRLGSVESDCSFPSWSWVGWISEEDTKLNNQHLTTEPLGIEFHFVSDDGTVVRRLKQRMDFNDKIDLLAKGSSVPNRSLRPFKILAKDLPPSPPVSMSSLLCFWSVTATLDVDYRAVREPPFGNESYDWEVALFQNGRGVPVSWSQIPELRQRDKVEIVAVAQNRGDWDRGHIANGAIGVMMISWKGGVAFRDGFAWIAILDWTALENRTWRLIVLG